MNGASTASVAAMANFSLDVIGPLVSNDVTSRMADFVIKISQLNL